ncbi:MAG: glutamate synthase subunit alpha [Spirochaetes bacterium GWB1_27_13]|nr:MAG: glutamate synthase subunit alpha [Spirochaetes bacterium GWB1_27_13]
MSNSSSNLPPLYNPEYEHDSCGVGFIANLNKEANHKVIEMALEALVNLTHRGAVGGDANTGDGAGILFQIPHEFLGSVVSEVKNLKQGEYGVGQIFFQKNDKAVKKCVEVVERVVKEEGFKVVTWRAVPTNDSSLGFLAKNSQPEVKQLFVVSEKDKITEQKLYILRRSIENAIAKECSEFAEDFYICTLSTRTICYKGMLLAEQLPEYFSDLKNPLIKSKLAVIHQRYSTNTFPAWKLAHPFRYVAHNGEINTLRGNVNKMTAREKTVSSPAFGEKISKLFPVIIPGGSDSACFDNCLEFLIQAGRSPEHSLMMMIPEAFGKAFYMSEDRRAFYEYYSSIMEPWDGPAAMVATDGKVICGTLDRNGLRPSRFVITKDGYVVSASEVGVLEIDPSNVKHLGRLQPGKMFKIDTDTGKVSFDNEVKSQIVRSKPYRRWLEKNRIELAGLFQPPVPKKVDKKELLKAQQVFGYTTEELKMQVLSMAWDGQEPVGSMGMDTPLAVLSEKPQVLFNYFKQLFAQVTNPPIDPYRENLVMSLMTWLGKKGNILTEEETHCKQLKLPHPVMTEDDIERLISAKHENLKTARLSTCFDIKGGGKGLEEAVDKLCKDVSQKVKEGNTIIILSDKDFDKTKAPIPSLLAVAAVHQYLITTAEREMVGLIVESGEPRETQHFALLIGYGANAVSPYIAFQSIVDLKEKGEIPVEVSLQDALDNFINAIKKGLLKTLSKMGISTLRSYQGAQIFEAVGVSEKIIDKHFKGTASRIGGIDYDIIAKEATLRHEKAFPQGNEGSLPLDFGGIFHYRKNGEVHLWNPQTIAKIQDAVKKNSYNTYKEFSKLVNEQQKNLYTIRGMFKFKNTNSIPLDQVEPLDKIFPRFATGAMSYGSISKGAHEAMAIAMNKLGGWSNTGEGGEDPERFKLDENGDDKCSKIKQVASGRFGVTINYLAHAKELQIKIAQGAKPGEGGQLPGHKVDEIIGKTRYSTPGVTLISPPPHHDIYSIEDIAQLIFDLHMSNLDARVSVKLVSEVGVSTVAAGVAKGKSDVVLISGYDGGTGASPVTSIQHAGLPWELGLAETQQVLIANHLRDKIRVQVDGKLMTGRDVIIAAILGAEEYGFATAALISMGCCMLRKCHLNTCTMGVATQDPDMKKLFRGKAQDVINYFTFVATEVREIMASLGVKSINELIGRTDLLEVNPETFNWKSKTLDFSKLLYKYEKPEVEIRCTKEQDHMLSTSLDYNVILDKVKDAIETKKPVKIEMPIRNIHRTVGTVTSGVIAKKYGDQGLPTDTIHIKFNGAAGQSFGAFLAHGVTLELEGYANDYLGKGLSGGKIIVYPPKQSHIDPANNIVVGNTLLYGATRGEVYIRGAAGERFAVRNSGVTAVIEGVGDHGCEYMTGGTVVVLGNTGRNFAAGMSGGIAYVLDPNQLFDTFCNLEMVDLLPLNEEEDRNKLKDLLTKHYQYTGSEKAKEILNAWEESIDRFVKVFPIDYRLALQRIKQAELTKSETMKVTEEVFRG